MILDYIKLAFNALTKRKLRSWLTLIGVFIGIAAVVSLIGLGEGLRNAITSQFGMMGTDILTVQASGTQFGPPGTGSINPLKKDYISRIKNINGVEAVIGRILESGKLEFNDRIAIGFGASVPDGEERKIMEDTLNLEPIRGRLLKDGDKNKAMLGSVFYEQGKDMYGKPIDSGSRILLQDKEFEVVGILGKKGNFMLDGLVWINEDVIRDMYDNKDDYNIIVIKVKKNADMDEVTLDVEKFLRKERDVDVGEEDFTITTPQQMLAQLNSTLFAVQLFVYIIAAVSLLVGGIGIMNTMYTAVLERTKEIGVMKAIGAKNSTIFFMFFIESGLLGSVGGLAGATIGALVAKGMAFAGGLALGSDLIQAQITIWLFIGSVAFAFIIGTIAGISPAIRASRLHPIDALRYAK
ncbi:ABC transporter permease [Nanoarchaeota archaeon]